MLQLSFNQKVGLGFFIIIFLLLISGLSSLWNLHDIDNSTTRVNDTAVPVVKESNRVQIQLLKLAKLSSLAYNATSQTDILKYQKDFEVIAERFEGMQKSLSDLTRSNAIMGKEFKSVQEHYRLYAEAVRNMFQAKLNVLQAKDNAEKSVGELMNRVDDVGGALLEIAYYRVSDEKLQEDMELVAGFANGADAKLLGVIKTLEEVRISTDLARLEQARDDFNFVFNDSRNLLESGARVFRSFDEEGMLDYTYEAYDALKAGLDAKPNVVDFRIRQLEEAEVAKQQLITADAEVSTAIAGLDNLLDAADTQFNTLQSDVFATLDFGFKSSIGMLIVLIVLAAQNFNSMRQAIRKKMIDLAKLNDIGRSLAAARDQNSALEEVLQSMHEKIGVDRGSVYLLNEDQQLEVRAYFPPKVVDPTIKPTKFTIGQGVLGQVAESKKVVFVPNTAKDKNFVSDKKQSGQALLCVPLVDKDVLIGVINLSGDVKKVAF
ncbi:MAG: GAF domain-containing protein, partial [Pseudomonadales bacterium]|nr:GAF domain-containing protein [Pseudomonadales bacterium]